MPNRFNRGSAPGRERDVDQLSGSFKKGHEKRGGRQRGAPNAFSPDYKKAILEAAYRVGYDGNGKHGLVGYFMWVALRNPGVYVGVLLSNLLTLQFSENGTPEEPRPSIEELNQSLRDCIGLTGKNPTKRQTVSAKSRATWDWTGQPFPVGSLM
jgi:hypothetical protein